MMLIRSIGKEIGRSASGGKRQAVSLVFAFARDAQLFGEQRAECMMAAPCLEKGRRGETWTTS
jgi:hypothetical protein